ncbi:MAG TPA: thioredoxin domain-containing protein [Thermoanaerobaculia bacterium]|nr:thioredoxin domain-containing protein [Thermoanaerobaculia bacterium]
MKTLVIGLFVLAGLASTTFAATPGLTKDEVEKLIAATLPACPAPTKVSTEPLTATLGKGIRATIVKVESANPWCNAHALAVATQAKGYFLGSPWILAGMEGTPAEKIRAFAWNRLQDTVEPKVESKPRADGFHAVTLLEKTESGVIRTSGVVDPEGTIYLPAEPRPLGFEAWRDRLEKLKPIVERAPAKGAVAAKVVVYEFSDFQCPSCKRSMDYGEKISKEFGSAVRFARVDFPLMGSHPWAYPAAVMGRAIWKQNPDAFWTYKNEVYENQSSLNVFMLEDFARGFVKDHGLDPARFASDIESRTILDEILNGVGVARGLGIQGTPTFMVDGVVIIPGDDGKLLFDAIRKKVAAK